ncbi:MAG: DUF4012 domain-containing protein [Kineosporiaceae bacterium]|nr:DUF4012 domain-containing protein [Aeromicrobium sp.]
MTTPSATQRAAMAHAQRSKRPLYKRWWFWTMIVVILLVAAGAWIGSRALQAKSNLESAIPMVATLKTQMLAQDVKGAEATLKTLKPKTTMARDLTSDPIWRAAEIVPGIGPNLSAVRQLAAVTDDVVNDGIAPLMSVAGKVSLANFKPVNGAVDVAPIVSAIPKVDAASSALDSALKTVNGIRTGNTISQVSNATATLKTMLAKVAGQIDQVKSLVHILPGALGNDGVRNYLVIFQNNGELMPRGGTTGSLALITVDHGKVSLAKQSSASRRDFPNFQEPVVALPDGIHKIYPYGLGVQVQNLTQTPRFSTTFAIAKEMWKQAKGDDIDGVIAVDTVALSYLVGATGPIDLIDGTQMTGANTIPTLLGSLYVKHKDPAYVDKIYEAMAGAAFANVTSGKGNTNALIAAVLKASKEKRILIWTSRKDEQKVIENSSFLGMPPVSTSKTDAFGIYYSDQTPSKLGFYLKENVQLSQAVCSADGKRHVRVSVSLTNTTPANAGKVLPTYVTGGGAIVPAGYLRIAINTYAPPGYAAQSVTSNGGPADSGVIGKDGDYPVIRGLINIAPGATQTLVFDFIAGNKGARILVAADITPTVSPTIVTTAKLDCASVTTG